MAIDVKEYARLCIMARRLGLTLSRNSADDIVEFVITNKHGRIIGYGLTLEAIDKCPKPAKHLKISTG